MRLFITFIFITIFATQLFAQDTEDTAENDELPLLNRYGYFIDKNALKISPYWANGAFRGASLHFEKGGIGKNYSIDFSLRYGKGYVHYQQVIVTDSTVTPPVDKLIRDSSQVVRSKPEHVKLEVQPRFYFVENMGVFVGASAGSYFNVKSKNLTPIIGIGSGINSVLFKRINFDFGVGVYLDTFGTVDSPLTTRISLNLGYVWYSKKGSAKKASVDSPGQ